MRAKESGQSPLLILDVIDILNKEKIPYAIVGAMAVSYYGIVRSSLDADAIVFIDYSDQEIENLKSKLKKKNLHAILKSGDVDDPLLGLILIEDDYGNRVDLILGIKGMEPQAYKRVRKIEFQGEKINMIGVEDLVSMKVFAGGQKDLADAQGVLAVSGEEINQKSLKALTKNYGQSAVDRLNTLLGQ